MSVMRKVLLAMSTSPFLREQATKRAFVRKSVSAFMPGEKVEDALQAAATLKPQRINTILTRLGEGVTKLDEAERVTQHYLDVLDKVKAAGLDAQISVKPTQLGLDLDADQCQRNLDRICEKAERLGNVPVWIDMENSPYVDPTLKLFRASKERYKGVGIAIQAYLYRTAEGHREPHPARPRHPHRQGGVPRAARGRVSEEVRRRRELLHALLPADAGGRAEDAARCCTSPRTTPRSSIGCSNYIDEHKVPSSAYEFAMLYGIQREPAAAAGAERAPHPRAHQLRRVLVPVVHAPPRRAPGQRHVRVEEPVRRVRRAMA